MEKVRPWCGQPSDRGRLRNRNRTDLRQVVHTFVHLFSQTLQIGTGQGPCCSEAVKVTLGLVESDGSLVLLRL